MANMVNHESYPASNLESKAEWKNAAFILAVLVAQGLPGLYFRLRYRDHLPANDGFNFSVMAWMFVSYLAILVVPLFWKGGMNPVQATRRFGSGRTLTNLFLGVLPIITWVLASAVFYPKNPHISQFSTIWDNPSNQGGMVLLLLLPIFLTWIWIPFILCGIRSEIIRSVAILGFFLIHIIQISIASRIGAGLQNFWLSSTVLVPVLSALIILGLARIGRRDNLGVALFLVSAQTLLFIPMPGMFFTQVPVYLVVAVVIWITSFMPSRHPSLTKV